MDYIEGMDNVIGGELLDDTRFFTLIIWKTEDEKSENNFGFLSFDGAVLKDTIESDDFVSEHLLTNLEMGIKYMVYSYCCRVPNVAYTDDEWVALISDLEKCAEMMEDETNVTVIEHNEFELKITDAE